MNTEYTKKEGLITRPETIRWYVYLKDTLLRITLFFPVFGTVLFCSLCLFSMPVLAQEQGFFKQFPSEGKWLVPSSVIETDDGSFIVAIDDDYYGGCGELSKLSAEGELLRSVPFNDEGHWSRVCNIFRHPQDEGIFIGMGTDIEPPFERFLGIPYLFHFDEELNLTFQKYPDWPDEFRGYSLFPTSLLGRDRKIFSEYFIYNYDRIFHFRRLYSMMTVDGDFVRIVEDTTDTHPSGSGVEAVFEFPGTKEKGMYRMSKVFGDSRNALFRINEGLDTRAVNPLYRFGEDTIITSNAIITLAIYLLETQNTTVIPMDNNTLLFSTTADESWFEWRLDTMIFDLDYSAVMFKTDTMGNIQQHCVIGSWNDTIESLPLRSIDVTEPDVQDNRNIYHCCYSRNENNDELPNTLAITKFTEDFAIIWRKAYTLPNIHLEPRNLIATSDGGCLIVGSFTKNGYLPHSGQHEWFALKLTPDGTIGTSEITVTDEIFFYPNPAKDLLHLHYPQEMQPTQIELYDLQGRLVRTQTTSFENLSMEGLAAGQYVMKVTMEDGKVFMDKVVKE